MRFGKKLLIFGILFVLCLSVGCGEKTPETGEEEESLAVEETPDPVPTLHPIIEPLDYGTEDILVAEIYQRLIDLGYLASPDGDGVAEVSMPYDTYIKNAVRTFQKKNDMDADGSCSQETFDFLMSEDAKAYYISRNDEDVIDKGPVFKLQKRLAELGYLKAEATGHCGENTVKAIQKFQEANGLSADGKAGQVTLKLLYSDEAVGKKGEKVAYDEEKLLADPTPTPKPTPKPTPEAGVETESGTEPAEEPKKKDKKTEEEGPEETPKPEYYLNHSSTEIYGGGVCQLVSYSYSEENEVTDTRWSSSDESVAMVDEYGVVVGLKKGKCTIKAKSNGKKAECEVTVTSKRPQPKSKLSVSKYCYRLKTPLTSDEIKNIKKLYESYSKDKKGQALALDALRYVGYNYGTKEGNIDCSMLLFYVGLDNGIRLPRRSDWQAESLRKSKVSYKELKPGDFMFFKYKEGIVCSCSTAPTCKRYKGIHHAAVYMGEIDGKKYVVEASSKVGRVCVREWDGSGEHAGMDIAVCCRAW